MGGAITGGHFDLILLDDPQSKDNVRSPVQHIKI